MVLIDVRPVNTRPSHNVDLTLGNRLRRWPNDKTTLGECLKAKNAVTAYLPFLYSVDRYTKLWLLSPLASWSMLCHFQYNNNKFKDCLSFSY